MVREPRVLTQGVNIPTTCALKASFQIFGLGMRTGLRLREARFEARAAAPDNPSGCTYRGAEALQKTKAPKLISASGLSGAATRIRTGDLILTKDVLYQLSHSSVYHEDISP